MKIPKLDKRNKEELMEEIKRLASSFTPDWNCNEEEPDVGFAAAQLFADMMSGTIEKYNRTAEKNMIEFYSSLGADRKYSEPSKGYVQLGISAGEETVQGERIEKNTLLSAESKDGKRIVFSTDNEIYVINSRITDVFCEDSEKDHIFCLCEDNESITVPAFNTFPYEEENLQQHILYFSSNACEYIYPNTKLRLELRPDKTEQALTQNFLNTAQKGLYYSTETGFAKCENVRLVNNILEFSFGETAPEKQNLNDIESQWFMLKLPSDKELSKVYLSGIFLGTGGENLPPDGIFGDNSELTAYRFQPFDINPVPYSSVYFACDTALCRRGSNVVMEMRVDYTKNPINDLQENDINWKHIMKRSQLKKPAEYEVSIRHVIWEYWNGAGWVRLFRDNSFSDVFNGKNDRCLVNISFKCPNDIAEALLPSGFHYAIRARIVSIENYMKQNGWYITPEISSPMFSYHYDALPSADYAVTENCLEKRQFDLSKSRSFQPCYFSRTHGISLYFGFTAAPEYAGTKMLFVCSNNEIDSQRSFVWEYYDGMLKNLSCRDETRGLSQTGIVTFNHNEGFAQKLHFNKKRYWIRLRFSDSENYPKTVLRKLCLNCVNIKNLEQHDAEYFYVSSDDGLVCNLSNSNVYQVKVMVNHKDEISAVAADEMIRRGEAQPVYYDDGKLSQLWIEWKEWKHIGDERGYILDKENSRVIFSEDFGGILPECDGENVMITYTVCNGSSANLAEGTNFIIEDGAGLISTAAAPLRLTGGLDRESLRSTLHRSAEALRMGKEICSADDYAAAVRSAERDVVRVRVFGGKNNLGEKEYGAVTVVVLLAHMELFPNSSTKIRKALVSNCCANVKPEKLYIIPPRPIFCSIKAEVQTDSYDTVGDLERRIKQTVAEYFDFCTGGDGKGWNIGSVPDSAAVYERIISVDGAVGISGFYINMTDEDGNEIHEEELEELSQIGMCIPVQKSFLLDIKVI